MNKAKSVLKTMLCKYGSVIAGCAFAFVTLSVNSSCSIPFYEPKEPAGLDQFKKIGK